MECAIQKARYPQIPTDMKACCFSELEPYDRIPIRKGLLESNGKECGLEGRPEFTA